MKKTLILALCSLSAGAFAANGDASAVMSQCAKLDTSKLECHCEKHKMIFDIKDGTPVSEMSKHCMINENKTKSSVKFIDDNSTKKVTCAVKNGKVELKTCQEFDAGDKSSYKHSASMSASQYSNVASHNN